MSLKAFCDAALNDSIEAFRFLKATIKKLLIEPIDPNLNDNSEQL